MIQWLEYDYNCYHILKILIESDGLAKALTEVFHLYKYLYHWLIISFQLIVTRVIKQFLEDWVYHSLANFNANTLKFFLHLFEVLEVYNIEGNLITDTFSDYPLCYTYHHMIFLNFFWLQSCVFALGLWCYWNKVPYILLDKHGFGNTWLYWLVRKTDKLFALSLSSDIWWIFCHG